ncbi:MAG: uncharacterized protein KVP18_000530 [Porospora cf. gigantea A]|uniref:uncharacterized protein n=1 Tax=Porospora cf. gigantea A TaxID=2853593 RepID=UPI00355A9B8B|nr:MAG: hypothetical protein KVP18_000530 [Porospora cf. gigantea A]
MVDNSAAKTDLNERKEPRWRGRSKERAESKTRSKTAEAAEKPRSGSKVFARFRRGSKEEEASPKAACPTSRDASPKAAPETSRDASPKKNQATSRDASPKGNQATSRDASPKGNHATSMDASPKGNHANAKGSQSSPVAKANVKSDQSPKNSAKSAPKSTADPNDKAAKPRHEPKGLVAKEPATISTGITRTSPDADQKKASGHKPAAAASPKMLDKACSALPWPPANPAPLNQDSPKSILKAPKRLGFADAQDELNDHDSESPKGLTAIAIHRRGHRLGSTIANAVPCPGVGDGGIANELQKAITLRRAATHKFEQTFTVSADVEESESSYDPFAK